MGVAVNRARYHALRRAAFEACRRYARQADSDGRSSYGSKSIMDLHALREAEAATSAVPRNREDHAAALYNERARIRRGRVTTAIRNRHADRCRGRFDDWYTRQVRQSLHPIPVDPVFRP